MSIAYDLNTLNPSSLSYVTLVSLSSQLGPAFKFNDMRNNAVKFQQSINSFNLYRDSSHAFAQCHEGICERPM
jgi:hypothetical protein